MSKALMQRRKTIEDAIEANGLTVAGRGVFGGSSMWMKAPDHVDTAELAKTLQNQSVHIEPGAAFFSGPDRPRNYYRLGYSSISADRIPAGIERVAAAIRAC